MNVFSIKIKLPDTHGTLIVVPAEVYLPHSNYTHEKNLVSLGVFVCVFI